MEKPRDIYDYRAGWLDRMCDRFGGTVRFADLVQKNPKHVSAMRSRKKAMGTKVARDIEAALAKARPDMADTLPGLFDTDPSAAPRLYLLVCIWLPPLLWLASGVDEAAGRLSFTVVDWIVLTVLCLASALASSLIKSAN